MQTIETGGVVMSFADIINWGTVGQIVVAITGCTTLTALLSPIAKFAGGQIADSLATKRKKKLVEHEADISLKKYVSKVRFDTEFELYKALSEAYFDMVFAIDTMIGSGFASIPEDKIALNKKNYNNAWDAVRKAQSLLRQNAPFIPEKFFKLYRELISLSSKLLWEFENRWNMALPDKNMVFETNDMNRSEEIIDKLNDLTNKLRDYIDNLDVIE